VADATPPTPGRPSGPPARVIEHRSTRQRRGRGHARIGLNLTAMIDVTFLLLIYFLLATEFKMGEEVYRLDLPPRLQSDQPRDPFELDEQPLRIRVLSSGLGGLQYQLRVEGPYAQPATFRELEEFLRERQINEHTSGGLFLPDHPIVIEPARTARWDHAVRVFNAAARARYENITFAQPG